MATVLRTHTHPPLFSLFAFPSLGSKWIGKRPTTAATVPFGARLKLELCAQVLRKIPTDVAEDSCSRVEFGLMKMK